MSASYKFDGPELTPSGVRFTLYAPRADKVELCLFDVPQGAVETARIGMSRTAEGLWQVTAQGAGSGQLYGFRVHGPWAPRSGDRFNAAKLLVDPCAAAVTGEPLKSDLFRGAARHDAAPDPHDSAAVAPKSIVVDHAFDWAGDVPPRRPWDDTLIYESHVRGLTMRHPEVPEELRGTYLGVACEPVVEHLQAIGVTALELLPIQQIASEPHLLEQGRRNYFGYSPLALRAPHAAYGTGADGRQVAEFKQMVKTLHHHGLEVILDVVFNHTAEGDHRGRTLSLRGIDNRLFYRLDGTDASRYEDFTGCGNTLAVAHPEVTEFIVDTLRYWVETMHVDGFRFDLATSLGRAPDRFSRDALFFRRLASTPSLADVKLIAEPWDLGPDGHHLGHFPPGWTEWNDRFRDTSRAIWRGDPVEAVEFVEIVDGSPSLMRKAGKTSSSINFVTAHDGFTLEDVVSYELKHNWDNGEENRDGHDHNLSRNWGTEGPTDSPAIQARRDRAKRNLLATLAVARGVPMLLHGDELGRTQRGNNNAYCQDNELTWIDWSRDERTRALERFIAELFGLRRRLFRTAKGREVRRLWLDANGQRLVPSAPRRAGPLQLLFDHHDDRAALALFNPGATDGLVKLPPRPGPGVWVRRLSTALPGEERVSTATYRCAATSVAILEWISRPERNAITASS